MTRDSEAQLLDFCAHQHGAFKEAAWLEAKSVSRDEMAAVCLFLGGVDWFGHRQQLADLGRRLLGGADTTFAQLVSRLGFDCARFSNLLKRRIGHA
jgi:hypothetical protein